MHDTVRAHLKRCRTIIEADLGKNASYLEIGALDVNGAASSSLGSPTSMWTGIDIVDGPGVDLVGDALKVMEVMDSPKYERYDVCVSTEGFEHMKQWFEIFTMMQRLAEHYVVVTCAAEPRMPHNALGGPGVEPGEWYQNIDFHDMVRAVDELHWDVVIGEYLPRPWGDINYLLKRNRK